MTEELIYDNSFARPDPVLGHRLGYVGVVRYLAFHSDSTDPKILTLGELQALHAAGLSVRANWEFSGHADVMGGAAAGALAGAEANRQLIQLGAPAQMAVYYSADWDAQPGVEWDAIEAYLRAAHVASGRRVGIYGSIWLVEEMLRRGAAQLGWQTVAWSNDAYGNPLVSKVAHLYQRITPTEPGSAALGGIDEDIVLHEDGAAWLPNGHLSGQAVPTPPPPSKEDDVQTICESTTTVKSKLGRILIKPGNVFLLPSGVWVNGKAQEARYIASGVAHAGVQKLPGLDILPFLK